MKNTPPFAEVIESSLVSCLAQSWQWDSFVPFGSLVVIPQANRDVIGIVYQIQTGSLDPTRYPFAYKKTEEELRRDQPQIFEFLKTTISCLIAGYYQEETVCYQLAPEPTKIHSFIYPASPELYKLFFREKRYLPLLFNVPTLPVALDELLLAMLTAAQCHIRHRQEDLIELSQTFNLLTGNDYRRLKLFLQRVQPLIL